MYLYKKKKGKIKIAVKIAEGNVVSKKKVRALVVPSEKARKVSHCAIW